jgi:hypothetical protein
MKYFFYNPYTKKSEGPYTIDMLRELVSKEQIQPDSKLCPPGGKKWIEAAEIGELFSPAPLPQISNEDDNFVHPLSKKGIKLQQKRSLEIQGWIWMSLGSFLLFLDSIMCLFIRIFLGSISYLIFLFPLIISIIMIVFGNYQLKKGKKINPDM